jgi:hypothetical protein
MLGLGLKIGKAVNYVVEAVSNWLLSGGSWTDSNQWVDSENWED